jgi:hypothetical protein
MKVGIELRIDVSKIEKERLYKGKKGTYLTMITFIDTEEKDKHENNGFISHKATEEERANKQYTPILGNAKVFYTDSQDSMARKPVTQQQPASMGDFDDDIPF